MKVTIKELAEKAGVSKTAVSFAFNNPKRISEETYNRIMKIAKDIGYSPDPLARILATKQTGTIGVLFPQSVSEVLQNPYISDLIRGIGIVCDREGLALTLMSPIKGILNNTIQKAAVDGMIIIGMDKDKSVHSAFKMRNMPYVAIDAKSNSGYINVGIDDRAMAETLMDMLLDNGHSKILFCALKPNASDLEEPDLSTIIEERQKGIQDSIAKHNVPESVTDSYIYMESETSFETSYRLAKQTLQLDNRPTAIYCMGDIQALGFYKAADELGLKIPEDLSVVSFDDLAITGILCPELTAVHQPGYDKGVAATELLIKQIAGKECQSVRLDAKVIKRKSVAKAKV